MLTIDQFFANYPASRALFDAVREAVEAFGPVEISVSKSQVAFKTPGPKPRTFALVWMPEPYLRRAAAPLVLTLPLRYRHPSPRWKEVVEPRPGRFTHHLEIYSPDEVDDEVRGWIKLAYDLT